MTYRRDYQNLWIVTKAGSSNSNYARPVKKEARACQAYILDRGLYNECPIESLRSKCSVSLPEPDHILGYVGVHRPGVDEGADLVELKHDHNDKGNTD